LNFDFEKNKKEKNFYELAKRFYKARIFFDVRKKLILTTFLFSFVSENNKFPVPICNKNKATNNIFFIFQQLLLIY